MCQHCTSETGVKLFSRSWYKSKERGANHGSDSKACIKGDVVFYSLAKLTLHREGVACETKSGDVCAGKERGTQPGEQSQWGLIYMLDLQTAFQ